MLHDRVSEGIRTICTQNQGFNQKQTEVLTEIAVHLALLFDSDMKAPAGFLRKLRVEVGRLGPVGKITFVGVAVTLLIGVAQIAHFGWTYAEGYITPPTEAEELEQITSIPGVATSSEAPAANSPSEHDSPDAQAKR